MALATFFSTLNSGPSLRFLHRAPLFVRSSLHVIPDTIIANYLFENQLFLVRLYERFFVVEWLKRRDRDGHGLGLKPTRVIL